MITAGLCTTLCTALLGLAPGPRLVVTEILYAVPRDAGNAALGDANLDGSRDAAGDEFVEIANIGDRPLDLAGWSIVDLHPEGDPPSFRFRFPSMRLPPGKVVVVFNGREQSFDRPHGSGSRAPRSVDPELAGSAVFDAQNTSARRGFANAGDGVALLDPRGRAVSWITWGTCERPAPEGCPQIGRAPVTGGGSVVCDPTDPDAAEWREHDASGLPYSPGATPVLEAGDEPNDESPDPFGTER